MSTEADIVERLKRSLVWVHDRESVIQAALAEITNLRAERDAAARDMRERCAKVAEGRRAELREKAKACKEPSRQSWFARAIEASVLVDAIRALPDTPAVIATDRDGGAT